MKPSTSYPKEKIRILLLEGIHPSAKKHFSNLGYKHIDVLTGALTEKELMKEIKNVHMIGIRSKTQLNKRVLSEADKLLAIGCFCIGTNQVDLEFARTSGIAVFNAPFSNTRSVAELVIANIIFLKRNLISKVLAAHEGRWLKSAFKAHEIRGKVLGIVGYGHIGSQVSVLAENMGMKVLFYDLEPRQALGNASAAKNLDDLLSRSDIVSLHVPGSESTRNLINKKTIGKMKKGSILLNLSRGDVIAEKDVAEALKSKHLAGLAADVFNNEPKDKEEPFKSVFQGLENVILTPHIGGSTAEAQEAIADDVGAKLSAYLESGASMGSLTVPPLNLPIQENAHRILHIHKNMKGVLSNLNSALAQMDINILGQYLKTNEEIGYVVLDVDKMKAGKLRSELKQIPHTIRVRSLY